MRAIPSAFLVCCCAIGCHMQERDTTQPKNHAAENVEPENHAAENVKPVDAFGGELAGPVVAKSNIRTASKGHYTLEAWTKGIVILSGPLGIGVQVTDNGPQCARPNARIRLLVHAARKKETVKETTFRPEFADVSRTKFRELLYTADGTLTESAKVAGNCTWRALIENPLEIGLASRKFLEPGEYQLDMTVEFLNGPKFEFTGMPFAAVATRDPTERKHRDLID